MRDRHTEKHGKTKVWRKQHHHTLKLLEQHWSHEVRKIYGGDLQPVCHVNGGDLSLPYYTLCSFGKVKCTLYAAVNVNGIT